jgi:hypothetical protein
VAVEAYHLCSGSAFSDSTFSDLTLQRCGAFIQLMISLAQIRATIEAGEAVEYHCLANLNLYDSPNLQTLATQAVAGRQLKIVSSAPELMGTPQTLRVQLCEDAYPGWLPCEDLDLLEVAEAAYCPLVLSESTICDRLPRVIAYAQMAMTQPNYYLWGGTVGPNYDCSGLIQTAFAANGIWLPRDAYQQEAFVQPIAITELQPGDLIFFGSLERATHVGLWLGEGQYLHSSGKDQGRNGIGIDVLSEQGGEVSQKYYRQLRGGGRVLTSYVPPTF